MVLQLSGESPSLVRTQLYRWMKSGKVLALRRQMYTLADIYRQTPVQTYLLANVLYQPSYLSCEWALGYFGLIPEKVTVHTSVTPRVPRHFNNAFGAFHYAHVKAEYFFGFATYAVDRREVRMAEPEKALLDLWHLQPGEWSLERMQDMRFQQFELVRIERLRAYAAKFKSPRLLRAARNWELVAQAEAGQEEKV